MQLSLYCSAKLGPACQAGLASATATAEEDSPIAASAAATKDLVGSDGVHSNAESTQVARVKWLQDLARLLKSMPPELRATIDQEMRQARTRVIPCSRAIGALRALVSPYVPFLRKIVQLKESNDGRDAAAADEDDDEEEEKMKGGKGVDGDSEDDESEDDDSEEDDVEWSMNSPMPDDGKQPVGSKRQRNS
jgi:hypothetical protein